MKYSNVYLKTTGSLSDAARDVGAELDTSFVRVEDAGEVFFVGAAGGRRVLVSLNDFLEPEYSPIDEYDVEAKIGGADDTERLAFARALAEKLSARGFRCLLTDNMVVLEAVEPKPASAD